MKTTISLLFLLCGLAYSQPSTNVDSYVTNTIWATNFTIQSSNLIAGGGTYLDIPVTQADTIDGWQISWQVQNIVGPVGSFQGIGFYLNITAIANGQTWRRVIGHGPNSRSTEWYLVTPTP